MGACDRLQIRMSVWRYNDGGSHGRWHRVSPCQKAVRMPRSIAPYRKRCTRLTVGISEVRGDVVALGHWRSPQEDRCLASDRPFGLPRLLRFPALVEVCDGP